MFLWEVIEKSGSRDAGAFAEPADRVRLQTNVSSMLIDPLHGTVSPTGTLRLIGDDTRSVNHVVNIMGRVRSCSPLAAVPGYRAC